MNLTTSVKIFKLSDTLSTFDLNYTVTLQLKTLELYLENLKHSS